MRDFQKNRVYQSEYRVYHDMEPVEYKSVAELQKYIDSILKKPAVIKRFGKFEIEVEDGRGRRRAGAGFNGRKYVAKFPRHSRKQWVVLHEVAHCLMRAVPVNDNAKPIAKEGHGSRFVDAYLFLVKLELGSEVHGKLSASFNVHECTTIEEGRVVSVSVPDKHKEFRKQLLQAKGA